MDALAIHAALLFAVLGHPSYSVRESVVVPPHIALEIRRRCQRIKEDMDRRAAVAEVIASYGRLPWIDALPPSYPNRETIIKRYIDLAINHQPYPAGETFGAWRLATELFLLDELCPNDAAKLLNRMPLDAWYTPRGKWALYQGCRTIELEIPPPPEMQK